MRRFFKPQKWRWQETVNEMHEPIIGIDLGTTNSEVAVWTDGRIEIVEHHGSPILPSCVGLDPSGTLLVGREAYNQAVLFPDRTVLSVKRLMGTGEKIQLGDRTYRPREISGMILRRLKEQAEQRLGVPVGKAVITVPAQFSDAQRQATRDAGAIAGLDVVRIINEPTAACLAYDRGDTDVGARRVLAFDLGGGTFDVSIVQMEGDVVEVIASHGDNHLGGDDMDALLADRLLEEVRGTSPEGAGDLTPAGSCRLRRAAETAKMHLSDHPHARVLEGEISTSGGELASLDVEIARAEFEDMLGPLLDRMLAAVQQALADAGMKPADVDEILLVGGATRVPAVQRMLEGALGKRPRRDVHPDLAVVYGAGVLAGRLMGTREQRVLVDITPCTFGTSCLGPLNGEMSEYLFVPVIRSGTPLPVNRGESFYTVYDNQSGVDVKVFQGEGEDARDNILIGRFHVEGLSRVPAGNEVVLNMRLDLDGILQVDATEKRTGLRKEVRIEDALAKLTDEEIERSRRAVEALFGPEASFEAAGQEEEAEAEARGPASGADAPRAPGVQDLARKIPELSRRIEACRQDMDELDRSDADRLLGALRETRDRGDREEMQRLVTELEDILFYAEVT